MNLREVGQRHPAPFDEDVFSQADAASMEIRGEVPRLPPNKLIKTSQTRAGIRKLIAIKWELESPSIHHGRILSSVSLFKINRLKQNN